MVVPATAAVAQEVLGVALSQARTVDRVLQHMALGAMVAPAVSDPVKSAPLAVSAVAEEGLAAPCPT
jgi:hypothetical protein